MKTIILIIENTIASNYGIGTYISNIKNVFAGEKDISLCVVEINSNRKDLYFEEINDIKYFYIPSVTWFNLSEKGGVSVRRYRNIAYFLKRYLDKQELIFHFNFNYHGALVSELKKIFPDAKTICTIHYLNWCFKLNGNVSYFTSLLESNDETVHIGAADIKNEYENDKSYFNQVDRVICLSNHTKVLLTEQYKLPDDKINVIYNAFEYKKSDTIESKLSLKKSMGFKENEQIVLFVGRLDQIKGLEYLIAAFRKIEKTNKDVRLVIAGDGDFAKYMALINGLWAKVSFVGKLKFDQLAAFYQIADVGVMPSFHEQCSYVAIEMMRFGLPIVGTTTTGLAEMIDEGKTGYKVELHEVGSNVELNENTLCSYIEKVLSKALNNSLNKDIQTHAKRYDYTFFKRDMKNVYSI